MFGTEVLLKVESLKDVGKTSFSEKLNLLK